jgi:glycosyltransferase involved in cell wall biosynthesis
LKILFVTQSLGKGGAERLVLDMAHALVKQDETIRVKILPLSPLNEYQDLSNGLDIEVCSSKVELSITGKSLIDITDFERIVDEFQPDVIHSHTYVAELVSREHIRPGIAYFTHVHNDFPEFDPLSFSTFFNKHRLARYYERLRIFGRYSQANNQFITISSSIDQHLKGQLSIKWFKNIHKILNGINSEKFKSVINHPKADETIQLISVGRFFPVKNQIYLIMMIQSLIRKNSDLNFHLHLIGDGPEKEKLVDLVESLELENYVTFHGIINDVENKLASSHVYVHAAISEPFGLVIAEALSASLPVICLNSGGPADIIDHEKNGFLLPLETSPLDFAETILRLVQDPDRYHSMAENAQKKGAQLDIKNCIADLLRLYKEAIRSKNA